MIRDRSRRASLHAVAGIAGVAIISTLMATASTTIPTAAQEGSDPAWTDRLDAVIEQQREALGIPGLAIAVVRDGVIAYEQGYGQAKADGTPVTPSTPFLLASTSKALTGLAVARLIAEQGVDPDTPLDRLAYSQDPGDQPTLRELLGHTSGLSRPAGVQNWTEEGGGPDALDRNAFRLLSGATSPDGAFRYSNANYNLLGAVIEDLTASPFAEAMQDLVFHPLGMTAATAGPPTPDTADTWYDWFDLARLPTPMPWPASGAPSAFMSASAHDLAQEVLAHLGGSVTPIEGAGPIPAGSLALAREPVHSFGDGWAYGMGWFLRPADELIGAGLPAGSAAPTIIEHDGSTPVTDSYVGFIPALGIGIAYVANAGDELGQAAWDHLPTALWRTVLGAEPGTPGPDRDPIQANAKPIYAGSIVLLAVLVLSGIAALRGHGGHRTRIVVVAVTSVVAAALCYLALAYAPAAGDTTVGTLVRWSPDLGLMTVAILVLTGVWVFALMVAAASAARRGTRASGSA